MVVGGRRLRRMVDSRLCVAELEAEFSELPLEFVVDGVELGVAAGGQVVEQAGRR